MKASGIFLLIVGVLTALAALLIDVTVEVDAAAIGISSTVNLWRLQVQMMLFNTGLAASVAGIALVAAATVLDRLSRSSPQRALPVQSTIDESARVAASGLEEIAQGVPIDHSRGDRIIMIIMIALVTLCGVVWLIYT